MTRALPRAAHSGTLASLKGKRRIHLALSALAAAGVAATAVATHVAIDTDGHSTLEQRVVPAGDRSAGFTNLTLGPGEPHMVREIGNAKAQAGRAQRRKSLAYVSQMTDFQLADEESPARVEFLDPGASSAHRPQEGLTAFQIEATIRQINNFAAASPVPDGAGNRRPMDFALLTGDQADNQHLNETVWVRDLLEGNGPLNFNSGLSDPADYADPAALGAGCDAFVRQEGGAQAAADEGARYTGVQDYDDYPADPPPSPLYYDPDEPTGAFATWPRYGGLLDRAQQIMIEPEGLDVPFYVTNGNHDVLAQGNEDANQAFEQIATGCFKALASTMDPTSPAPPDGPDPNPLLSPANVGMLVPPDPRRQYVSKIQIKELYGATDEGAKDDDHGFAYVDPDENAESNFSASYYAWEPEQTPGLRFISIDTNSEGGQTAEGVGGAPGSSNGNLDDPQFQWLKRELQAAKARNQVVVIFGHHPVRSMNTEVRDEQAAPCTVEDEHDHDVNPGCDLDPRPSDDDPDTPGFGCIHNGTDAQNRTCPGGHESFVELIDQFPNVVTYIPGHTHEHQLTPFERTDKSVWWEVNTSAVIDYPNQSRLVELMDNRDGTLSIFNTVVDHAAPASIPPACPADSTNCAMAFTEPQLSSIGRALTYNDHQNDLSGAGDLEDRNAELLLGDPRPVSDLAVTQTDSPDPVAAGRPLTYTVTVTNGAAESHDTTVVDELAGDLTVSSVTPSKGSCTTAGLRIECDLGTLAAGQTARIAIVVTPQEPGQVSSTATVRGNVSDREAGNDTAQQTTTVTEAPVAEEPAAPPATDPTATPTPRPRPRPSATPGSSPEPPSRRAAQPCSARAFDRVEALPRGPRVVLSFRGSPGASPARIDIFQSSSGRRVVGERLVARFPARTGSFIWNGKANRDRRRVTDGYYFVRLTATDSRGLKDVRRRVLRRSGGRWSRRPGFEKRASCGLISTFKLERPVFGGTTRRTLHAAFRLEDRATTRIEVLRGRRVVKRLRAVSRPAGTTFRIRVDRGLRRRGDYRVRLTATRGKRREVRVLVSRRL